MHLIMLCSTLYSGHLHCSAAQPRVACNSRVLSLRGNHESSSIKMSEVWVADAAGPAVAAELLSRQRCSLIRYSKSNYDQDHRVLCCVMFCSLSWYTMCSCVPDRCWCIPNMCSCVPNRCSCVPTKHRQPPVHHAACLIKSRSDIYTAL